MELSVVQTCILYAIKICSYSGGAVLAYVLCERYRQSWKKIFAPTMLIFASCVAGILGTAHLVTLENTGLSVWRIQQLHEVFSSVNLGFLGSFSIYQAYHHRGVTLTIFCILSVVAIVGYDFLKL